MDPGSWERIPNEILEKILIAVPTYQLPFNEAWVCKKWTRIILQPQFWSQKLKSFGISIDDKIWDLLHEYENHVVVTCLYHTSLYQAYRTEHTPCLYKELICPKHYTQQTSNPTNEDFLLNNAWIISDNLKSMQMALGILICKRHMFVGAFVHLYLKRDKIKVLPLLLKLIVARNVPFSVWDEYAFWNFSSRLNYFHFLNRGSCVRHFKGCLPTLEGLPPSIGSFILSIGVDDQKVAIDPGLSRITRIKQYAQISLHFKAGTNISNLTNISSHLAHNCDNIIVSGLEERHILWMTEVTKYFLINGYFSSLIFFDYQLDLKSSKKLLNSIANAGFTLGPESEPIRCSSPTLDFDSEKILNALSVKLWPNCDILGFQWYHSNEYLISESRIIETVHWNNCGLSIN